MTNILFYKKDNQYNGIDATDHAETQIVCAGISTVLQGLAGAVMNNEVNITEMVIEDGRFRLRVDAENDVKTDAMFFLTYVTLKQLEKAYPNEICIIDIGK